MSGHAAALWSSVLSSAHGEHSSPSAVLLRALLLYRCAPHGFIVCVTAGRATVKSLFSLFPAGNLQVVFVSVTEGTLAASPSSLPRSEFLDVNCHCRGSLPADAACQGCCSEDAPSCLAVTAD